MDDAAYGDSSDNGGEEEEGQEEEEEDEEDEDLMQEGDDVGLGADEEDADFSDGGEDMDEYNEGDAEALMDDIFAEMDEVCNVLLVYNVVKLCPTGYISFFVSLDGSLSRLKLGLASLIQHSKCLVLQLFSCMRDNHRAHVACSIVTACAQGRK